MGTIAALLLSTRGQPGNAMLLELQKRSLPGGQSASELQGLLQYWYKCSKKTTHNSYKSIGAKVKFSLSGTSYVSSSTLKLKATATLNAGPVKGSSTTSCGIGSKPQCCFKFPSPVGKRCLKLY